jgi:hypothetical protein
MAEVYSERGHKTNLSWVFIVLLAVVLLGVIIALVR